jgi:DTW domain-containing protein
MARSVVLRPTPRCGRCQLAPRWCICAVQEEVSSPLAVDVLIHFMEAYRPSSTGELIKRIMPATGRHVFRKDGTVETESIHRPGRELWILHPEGEPLPAGMNPAELQVLLLDGNWRQAGTMSRAVGSWGRRVRLPMEGESRYWLREQAGPGKFCTAEALLFLLAALGEQAAHDRLRAQFELHVHAGLLSRGLKIKAAEYLFLSPVAGALEALIRRVEAARQGSGPG